LNNKELNIATDSIHVSWSQVIEYMIAPHGIKLMAIGGDIKGESVSHFGKECEAWNAECGVENDAGSLYRFQFPAPRRRQGKTTLRIF
jgi:hypothetical protein